MIFKFIKEYQAWKKEHRQEVQQAKLRQEAMKTPLNYAILDQMFQTWLNGNDRNAVMEIKGKDFTVKCYYDDKGNYQRLTTTEQILNLYKGISITGE